MHLRKEPNNVLIVGFDPKFAGDFARLNYEWIDTHFKVEEHDRWMLDEPEERIIKHGGEIFFAVVNDHAAGTVAMLRADGNAYELAKMAVSPLFRGSGIGDMLMAACIKLARENGASKIFLESNRVLEPAIRLYEKHGFTEVPIEPDTHYDRVNIRMELAIKEAIL